MLDAVGVGSLPSARFGPNRFSSATRASHIYNRLGYIRLYIVNISM